MSMYRNASQKNGMADLSRPTLVRCELQAEQITRLLDYRPHRPDKGEK